MSRLLWFQYSSSFLWILFANGWSESGALSNGVTFFATLKRHKKLSGIGLHLNGGTLEFFQMVRNYCKLIPSAPNSIYQDVHVLLC